jgi:HAD superfamily phosphatase (TIGR01668 family)
MPLFPLLQPDLVLGSSVFDLTPELLDRHQIKGLVLDVDDTIVPIGNKVAQPELLVWIDRIRQVGPLCLVTNNPNKVRIGAIADSLSLPYFLSAKKPSRRKLRQAVADMQLEPSQVAMVGDRVFTDVLAGNRLGMFTILIEPTIGDRSSLSFDLLRRIEFAIARASGVSLRKTHKS